MKYTLSVPSISLISSRLREKMDSTFEKSSIVSFYCITTLFNWFCSYVIVKYHRNKPLGLQTLFSKVIVLLTFAFAQASTTSTIVRSLNVLAAPLDETLAIHVAVLSTISGLTFLLAILITLITKYLSVYHSTLISNANDDLITPCLWIVNVVMPYILAILEYNYLTDIRKDETFLVLILGPDKEVEGKSEVTTRGVMLANVVTAIIVQTRIEMDHHETGYIVKIKHWFQANDIKVAPQREPSSVGPDQEEAEDQFPDPAHNFNETGSGGYKISVLRLLLVLAAILMVIVLAKGTGMATFIFFRLFFSVICPMLFILTHDGIRHCLASQLKTVVSYCKCQ